MSAFTFDTILVPVASEDDARATSRAIRERFDPSETVVEFVFVVEKAGGAPDKASVEQREELAEKTAQTARAELPDARTEMHVVYDTDVADAIRDAAADVGADAIVFVPREGSRLARWLSGDVTLSLVTESDRPVVALPSPGEDA